MGNMCYSYIQLWESFWQVILYWDKEVHVYNNSIFITFWRKQFNVTFSKRRVTVRVIVTGMGYMRGFGGVGTDMPVYRSGSWLQGFVHVIKFYWNKILRFICFIVCIADFKYKSWPHTKNLTESSHFLLLFFLIWLLCFYI